MLHGKEDSKILDINSHSNGAILSFNNSIKFNEELFVSIIIDE